MTAILVGFVILLLGAAGLLYPERMLGLLGFAVQNPSHVAAALGEVRATYGGLFIVIFRKGTDFKLPYGTFIGIASLAAVFWGQTVWNFYMLR